MNIVTRFAPSPTGFLHIGGARTALFNYLFAKRHGGKFLLRIEDTDKSRSTDEAKDAIIDSMNWLDIKWDGEIIYQSEQVARHQEVAQKLLDNGKAYYCFTPQEEIVAMRAKARERKEHFIFNSPWRDKSTAEHPSGVKPVIRLKAPESGTTIVHDLLQGDVIVDNSHLDDMILLRSDGTPTYMLAVVVDDHDMGVTHIIRGDDHLSNAHRQQLIYTALGWDVPKMVHIPLIHGPDGAKLSKRHGALGAEQYKEMGYLPEALNNYLLRLGWSHGDDEYINRVQATQWFSIDSLGKSPARLDFDKMKNMNAHYIGQLDDERALSLITGPMTEQSIENITRALPDIKPRAELTSDLSELAKLYMDNMPLILSDEGKKILNEVDPSFVDDIVKIMSACYEFSSENIQSAFKEFAKSKELKLGGIMKYVRILVTGQKNAPSMFNLLSIIGLKEALRRIQETKQQAFV